MPSHRLAHLRAGARALLARAAPRARQVSLWRLSERSSREMSSSARYVVGGIAIDPKLREFVERKVLPGTGVNEHGFWSGLDSIVADLMPMNASLLNKRHSLQMQIDKWHRDHPAPYDPDEYESFLCSIEYLEPASEPFTMQTSNVDEEIATIAGPQLVCPVDNERFILNAANARWGSMLDAIYATNAIPALPGRADGTYDPVRGAAVFRETHRLLDEFFPLMTGSWDDVSSLTVADGTLRLRVHSQDGSTQPETKLRNAASFVGFDDCSGKLSLLLVKNGLRFELVLDKNGGNLGHKAGLVDVKLESALSTICDFEDSASTVDVDDKVHAYSNWLGLMQRSLSVQMDKGGKSFERKLNPRRHFTAATGDGTVDLPGQALLLARNVGMHMYTDLVTTVNDCLLIPEHFLDAMVTAAAAMHDLYDHRANSRLSSIYIVKPKMHGPEEVALAVALMDRVEQVLGLPNNTIKIGVMDEERRMSLNLAASMKAVKERLFFVNTGFLDRTADEIHTSMEAGPMLPKAQIKTAAWYGAYEEANVVTALRAQLVGKGQIGKERLGMWAEPDDMKSMLATKGAQLTAGASTAWVPSPTAATLHALHYLRTSVPDVQRALSAKAALTCDRTRRRALLTPPLLDVGLSGEEVQRELDNNAQGLLGYVVRWVGQGIGCSKVPNLQNVQLMEDRATLRISSQHIANWLHHGVVSEAQVMETLRRVAALVDAQNSADPAYTPMAPAYDGPEWHAAVDLIFHGRQALNGYTEPTLTHWRKVRKAGMRKHGSGAAHDLQTYPEGEYRGRSSIGGAM